MSDRGFDELSRALAHPRGRRSALKAIGATVGATVGTVLVKPFRADAACPAGTTPCGTACCQKGVSCYDAATAICGCPSGTTPCAQNNILTCAPKGQSCDSGGPWPAPNTRVKNCRTCQRLMDTCFNNNDCCSNICTPHKLFGACGCASDSDCPSSGAPYCDPKTGVCHA